MSEFEETPEPQARNWLMIGAIGVLVMCSGVLACGGLIGVGFVMPVRQARRAAEDAARADAETQQALKEAGLKMHKEHAESEAANEPPAEERATEPATDSDPSSSDR